VDNREFFKLAHGSHGASLESILIRLEMEGEKSGSKTTLIKEIQHDPFSGDVIHLDFNEVSLTEKITTHIPIMIFGTSKGEKEGGIADHTLRELEISCLPTDLPEEIKVDISDLGLHDSLHVRDLDLGERITVHNDESLSIVSIVVPRIVEEPVAEVLEEEAEVAEPEVIGKGGEIEEGEERVEGEKE
jgi:large subunit ribosomal protein L25